MMPKPPCQRLPIARGHILNQSGRGGFPYMTTRISLAIRMLCPLLALAAVAVTAGPARADDNEGQTTGMNGAWQFVLASGSRSFTALGTFTQDGIFVGTAQGDGLCCASQGAAHGTWRRIG